MKKLLLNFKNLLITLEVQLNLLKDRI